MNKIKLAAAAIRKTDPIRRDDFALLLGILERDIDSYEKEVPLAKIVKILRE